MIYVEKKNNIEVVDISDKRQSEDLPGNIPREVGEAIVIQKKIINIPRDCVKLMSFTESKSDSKFVDANHHEELVEET